MVEFPRSVLQVLLEGDGMLKCNHKEGSKVRRLGSMCAGISSQSVWHKYGKVYEKMLVEVV